MDELDPIAAMKARWSYIQPFLFPFLREEIPPLTAKLEQLIHVLDTIGLEAYVRAEVGGPGRPREDRRAIARAFVAKAVLGLPTTRALIERLTVDASVRCICGWERRAEIPSEPTSSRAFQEFIAASLADREPISARPTIKAIAVAVPTPGMEVRMAIRLASRGSAAIRRSISAPRLAIAVSAARSWRLISVAAGGAV